MLLQERLLIISLISGFLYTLLIYGNGMGVSYPIFSISAIILLLYMLKSTDKFKKDYRWLLAIPIILLSLIPFLSDNMFFYFFSPKISMVLFVAMTLLLVGNEVYRPESLKFAFKIIETIIIPIRYFTKPYSFVLEKILEKRKVKLNSSMVKIILGVLISLPILFVIIVLLSTADMVFSEMIKYIESQITSFFRNLNFANYGDQIIIFVLISTYTYGYGWNLFMASIPSMKRKEFDENNLIEGSGLQPKKKKFSMDATILITVLIMINIVYFTFCFIQFSYLFSSYNTLPGNFTYAQYARQGFFQLLLVTMLNFLLILISLHFSRSFNMRAMKWIQRLLLFMGIFTYIMIYSSFYRMGLYSQNYGYTYLRIFVYFFLFLEVPLLGATLVYIYNNNFNLIRIYLVTGLVFYMVLNFINVDNMIAKNNIDRYFETGKVDINYLAGLSHDAVPQLTRLLEAKNPKIQREIKKNLIDRKESLKKERSWREFNYSRFKAREILRGFDR